MAMISSNYTRTKPWILLLLITLLIHRDVTSPTAKPISDIELCKAGERLTNYTLRGAREAGKYYEIDKATTFEECIALCCSSKPEDCHLALFVKNTCYAVECKNAELCKPIKIPPNATIKPSIFRRHGASFHYGRDLSFQLPDVKGSNATLTREKRFGSCRRYTDKTCARYLDQDRLVYYDETPNVVERRLSGPYIVIEGRFKPGCLKYALPALCLTSFPYCESKPHPQPIRLCREDCEKLYNDVCKHDFDLARRVAEKYPPLLRIMPNCSDLVVPTNKGDDCVKLGFNEGNERVSTIITSSVMPTTGQKTWTAHSMFPNTVSTRKKTSKTPATTHHRKVHNKLLETKEIMSPYIDTETKHTTIPPMPSRHSTGYKMSTVHAISPTTIYEGTPKHADSTDNKFESIESLPDTKKLELENVRTSKVTSSVHVNAEPVTQATPPTSTVGHIEKLPSPTIIQGNTSDFASTEASPIHIGKHKSDGAEELSHQLKTSTSEGLEISNNSFKRSGISNRTRENVDKDAEEHINTKLISLRSTVLPVSNVSQSPLLSSVFTSLRPTTTSEAKPTSSLTDDSITPTIISTNGTQDGLQLDTISSAKEKVSVNATPKTKPSTSAPVITLHVSTVGDTEIVLPKDTASLYASAWPKETQTNPYTYKWSQLAAPADSHGYMEGKNAQRIVLTQLTKPGIYQFQVIVRGKPRALGKAYVNVTVKERERVNKPPRANVSPKEQSITLPTNEVVLDGSKSSDDDKIVKYKWQELKGPLTEKDKTIKSGMDSPILQLKSLLPGVYTYKLTVKDSDDETDSVVATVTVNAEKDYPPVARAGNDVVITLPVNYVTLYGNGSTDDHRIKSYEWSKSPLSPPCDLQGTTESILHVSNMVQGDYTFTLKVTDSGDHSTESQVTVVVRPQENSAPVAKAGDDKDLVYPDDSTTLNAKDSHDDQGISRYLWQKESGPAAKMTGIDKMILNLSHLTEGHYVFKLTVFDSKGLSGSDLVNVNVKRDGNTAPQANAGPDVLVKLPKRAAALDGSRSSDDYGIVKYTWLRHAESPAAGEIVNGSDHQAVLRLSNLVKGVYNFRLTVVDGKGLASHDDAKIIVKEDENSPNLVELYLDVDVTSFTEENKKQLIRKLAVTLNVMDEDIIVEHIQPSGRGNRLVVVFYVKDNLTGLPRDGKEIADLLKQKLHDNFFEFKMEEVEPYFCRNNCSGHGYCDQHTKQCICESFWMQDPFKAHFGLRERNCDWSILYVIVIIFGVIVAIVGITWGICFCLGRTKTRYRRNQYSIVGDEDSDDVKNTTMELFPRGKYMNSSIMSETDMDTDEETLFENQKPYKGSRTKLNGMINGSKIRHT